MRLLLIPVFAAGLAGQTPAFEVASIRPTGEDPGGTVQAGVQITQAQVRAVGLPLKSYIAVAYRLEEYQVLGPAWLGTTRFDINAKLPDGTGLQQIPEMIQALLAERFKMQSHRETRDLPAYALVVAKNGLKISPVDPERDVAPGAVITTTGGGTARGVAVELGRGSSYSLADNRFEGRKVSMMMLARTLTPFVGRPVVDMTNTTGFFDITAQLTPQDYYGMLARSSETAGTAISPQAAQIIESSTLDSLFAALENAGLALESRRMPRDVLVVDSIEKVPTPN